MLLTVLLPFLFFHNVRGDCTCSYTNQTYDPFMWPQFWIQNAFNDDGTPCSKNCTVLLNSGKSTMGIGNYKRQQWDPNTTGNLYFYNSDSLGTKKTSPYQVADQSLPSFPEASNGQYVLVEVQLNGVGNVLATLEPVTPAVVSTTPQSTPPTTTTPDYDHTYISNPALISNDLLIMVDAGQNTPNGPADFQNSKTFAAAVVRAIAPSVFTGAANDGSPVTGTRLALNSLNFINSGPLVMPWEDNATDIASLITNLPALQSKKTLYSEALNFLADPKSIFNPANLPENGYMNSRNTAQRILMVVASSAPASNDPIFTTGQINFATYDIHPIFVGFNLSSEDSTTASRLKNSGWTVASVNDSSDPSVKSFVNNYLLSNICTNPSPLAYNADDNANNIISYGFKSRPQQGQSPDYIKNRYCNFQSIRYTVKKPQAGGTYCFTVFYELEVEKDSLKFWQCNTNDCSSPEKGKYIEYVNLSGIDVSGSTFYFTNDSRIDFSSNESGVYGGFYVTISKSCS